MTNGDRIRQMTDEELALLLATDSCPVKDSIDRCYRFDHNCKECWLAYLREEANDG